jgi:diguanylate cyclase (GGDEF)-like protein
MRWSLRKADGSWDKLLSARFHSSEVSRERYSLLLSRVQFVSRFFCVFTLLWIGMEFVFWPWPVSGALALERTLSAAAFWILGAYRFEVRARGASKALLALLLLPSGLILGAEFVLVHSGAYQYQLFGTQAYLFSPIVLAATLSIFPLTVRENLLLAVPMIPVTVFPMIVWPELFDFTSPMAVVLLLLMVAAISVIASLNQLNFLISLVEKSATDGLTGAVTRTFGEQMLETVFAISQRKGAALCLLFIDIDRFKSVNDRFGHSAGDEVLRDAAASIRSVARRQDVLVRWGGEEFVLIMPQTSSTDIESFVGRLARTGIGRTPDAVPITASIGAAERVSDEANAWADLVETADRRMYLAKEAGRNCYVGPKGITVAGVFGSPRPVSERSEDMPRKNTNADADLAAPNETVSQDNTRMKELVRC